MSEEMGSAMGVLKLATAGHHARVEATVAIERRCAARDSYAELLVAMHGFYAPFEPRLAATPGLADVLDDLPARVTKSAWLEQDLAALGASPGARCTRLPEPAGLDEAFGALYVLEGATLGGAGISRIARARVGVTPDDGCAFFHNYGPERGARWRAFAAAVDAYAGERAAEHGLVAGAQATFDALEAWLTIDDTMEQAA